MRTLLFLSAALLLGTPALAEEPASTRGGALSTNIIGSQEAPTVMNVVPWKSKDVQLEARDPTSSLLNRVLEPLDQDVLMREVEYYRILGQESGGDGLFMD
jgi:hypothetical protein